MQVFALELGWNRLMEASEDIRTTLGTIDQYFDPGASLALPLVPPMCIMLES